MFILGFGNVIPLHIMMLIDPLNVVNATLNSLTHLSLASLLWGMGQNAESHLGLFCLLIRISSKIGIKF